jgi:hypothetical protein
MRKTRDEKHAQILNEMYQRAFAASEPPADFNELLENAETNALGQKVIPYMDHECDRSVLEEIFESTMAKYKIKDKLKSAFSFHFWLGCSPKTKKSCSEDI